jgi:hypothetical protein
VGDARSAAPAKTVLLHAGREFTYKQGASYTGFRGKVKVKPDTSSRQGETENRDAREE